MDSKEGMPDVTSIICIFMDMRRSHVHAQRAIIPVRDVLAGSALFSGNPAGKSHYVCLSLQYIRINYVLIDCIYNELS